MSEMTPSLNAGPKLSKPTRPPPLELPCDVPHSRPQRRDVASRYLDTTSSSSLFHSSPYSTAKRCQSPNVTRTNLPASPSVAANRPQSTGRRQQLDRRGGGGEVSAAERMLLTSGRSLFSSFQADSSYRGNGNRSKLYPSPPSTPRRVTTVEKRKTASTASGVAKEEKSKLSDQWPRSCLSRSIDFMDTLKGSCNSVASRPLQNSSNSMIPRKISVDSLALPSKVVSSTTRSQITRPASPRMVGTTPTASSPRGASIARGLSPSRGPRVISPSGRMVTSPLRMRSSQSNKEREKSRENNGVADDAHVLKLLHNRLLQWRFANARATAVISAQKMTTEKRLYNSWISISKLYVSVRAKRIEMQRLKLNLKLMFILNRQIGNLEEWLVVEMDYVSSLVGAAEGLKGSTLCLPVDCVAKVNGQSMKDAISSAVDVMQAMASSICLLLPKVGKISCLAAELALVNIKEQEMLDVCRELLNAISALQVRESSFQTLATQLHT
ncbi:hypothetical protein Bca4012_013236 [Brassica carinata]|uniref:Uncharacterized protein n=1 Tax=Brassica carinata TaxID=52824 RepID=A0A8X7Q395_BRACI|nr:hypothetical protein Bca52824_069187 [Brassica carinata]